MVNISPELRIINSDSPLRTRKVNACQLVADAADFRQRVNRQQVFDVGNVVVVQTELAEVF